MAGMVPHRTVKHEAMPELSELDEVSSSYLRALTMLDRGMDDAAVIHLDRMLTLSPYDVGGLLHRGEALARLGRYDDARADLLEVLAIMPNGSVAERAIHRLGLIAYFEGDLVAALARFTTLVEMDPDNAQALCERGIAHAALHHDDAAIQDLRSAIAIDPGMPQAHAHLAITLFRNRQKEDACEALEKAYALGDRSVEELMLVHCSE